MGHKENAYFVRWEAKKMLLCEVGNKDNACFVRWEWWKTKRMLILLGGKQKESLFCEVGNQDNDDFVRWETKRMLIL